MANPPMMSSSSSSSSPLKTSKLERSSPPAVLATALGCVQDGAPLGPGAVRVRSTPAAGVRPPREPPSSSPLARPPSPPAPAERGEGGLGCRRGVGDGSNASSPSLLAGVRTRLRRARAPAGRWPSRITALASATGATPSSADVGTLRLPRGPTADEGVATGERSGLTPTATPLKTSSLRSARAASPSRNRAGVAVGVEKAEAGACRPDPLPGPGPRAKGEISSSDGTPGESSLSSVADSGWSVSTWSASNGAPLALVSSDSSMFAAPADPSAASGAQARVRTASSSFSLVCKNVA